MAALCIVFCLSAVSCATSDQGKAVAAEYYAIAEGYADISKYDKAIDFYRKSAVSPDFENAATYGLGRMYALSGKWGDASELFGSLYLKDKTNTFTASAYAFSLASSGAADKALAVYEGLYFADMENPALARDYAEILVIAKKYREALDQIAYIREHFPDTDALKDIDALEKKANDGINPPAPASTETPGAGPASPDKPALPPAPAEPKKNQ